jgi:hypothetical protein
MVLLDYGIFRVGASGISLGWFVDLRLIFLVAALAGFFYLLIPGLGAFFVRSQWRKFRAAMLSSSRFPEVSYRDLRKNTEKSGPIGRFRFIGALEAIQDDDIIWLKSREFVISADMKGQKVYLLPSLSTLETETLEETNEVALPNEIPAMVAWEKVSTLPEGTKVLIAGPCYLEKGKGLFRSGKTGGLLVVFYEGHEVSIARSAIWSGRHRNEYWNPFTPGALAGGTLSLIIIAYLLLKNPVFRVPAILSLGFSLAPVIPLFPPGMVFFILYRRFWGRARFLRAERDLVRLPLRYFPDSDLSRIVPLENGEKYVCRIFPEFDINFLKGRGKLRTTSLAKKHPRETRGFYWFGILSEEDEYPRKSMDPMAESVVTPDHPEILARECEKHARRSELLSALFFFLGFGINFLLVIRGLAWIIR